MTAQPKRRRRTKAQMEQARRRREASRRYHLKTKHRMTLEQYDALLELQGGVCYICCLKPGRVALAVDHDHAIARDECEHPHEESCENCWRGLLHRKCNDLLAYARDSIAFFERTMDYLIDPPAQWWRDDRESTGTLRG